MRPRHRAPPPPFSPPARQPGGAGLTYPTLDLKEFQKIPLVVGDGLVAMFKKTHPLNVGGEPVVVARRPDARAGHGCAHCGARLRNCVAPHVDDSRTAAKTASRVAASAWAPDN